MSPAPKKRSWRSAAKAHQRSKDLGPLDAVEPAAHRVDGSPQVGPGQVYVTRTGVAFHPAWCLAVGTAWDDKPEGLFVIAASTVGGRRLCKACEEPLQA